VNDGAVQNIFDYKGLSALLIGGDSADHLLYTNPASRPDILRLTLAF
jgi:hypothetical protein